MVIRVFSKSDLMQLVDRYEPPCVSLFMPTHSRGSARRQDDIRLKNLVREAEHELKRRDVSPGVVVRQLLHNVEQIPQDLQFWRHRSQGMAVYCSPELFRRFILPLPPREIVLVSDHFHISPLVPLLHSNGRFFVLALTKDSADLYEATRYSLVERDLPKGAPLSLDDARPPLQYHSHHTSAAGNGKSEETIFHGHGGADDREKADVANFFKRQVEPAVSDILRDQHAPLVLACVDYLATLYRAANSYPHLVSNYVSGSPSEVSENLLREKAWEVAAPVLRNVELQARDKFEHLAGTDRTQATTQLVVESACRGRVDTLFVPMQLTGGPQAVKPMSNEAELVEEAAEQTLLFGGRVLAVDDVPGDSALAAVLRY